MRVGVFEFSLRVECRNPFSVEMEKWELEGRGGDEGV